MFELTKPRYLLQQRRRANIAWSFSSSGTRRLANVASLAPRQDHVEEQEKREMKWLIRTMCNLLDTTAPLNGNMIQNAYLVMEAWSDRSERKGSNAPNVVERILLTRLMDKQDGGNPNVIIIIRTENIVIVAWSRSDCEGVAQRAEEILCQMEQFHNLGNEHVKPDVESFTGAIKAWVKRGDQQYAVSKS